MNPQPGWGWAAGADQPAGGQVRVLLLACFHSRDRGRPRTRLPNGAGVLIFAPDKAEKAPHWVQDKRKLWLKPQLQSLRSPSISQDELGYAAVTNTSPAPSLRGFQQQS